MSGTVVVLCVCVSIYTRKCSGGKLRMAMGKSGSFKGEYGEEETYVATKHNGMMHCFVKVGHAGLEAYVVMV